MSLKSVYVKATYSTVLYPSYCSTWPTVQDRNGENENMLSHITGFQLQRMLLIARCDGGYCKATSLCLMSKQ